MERPAMLMDNTRKVGKAIRTTGEDEEERWRVT
jgi:hypothetical protein